MSPNGKIIALGYAKSYSNNNIHTLTITANKIKQENVVPNFDKYKYIYHITISPNTTFMASVGENGDCDIYNIQENYKHIRKLNDHSDFIHCCAPLFIRMMKNILEQLISIQNCTCMK